MAYISEDDLECSICKNVYVDAVELKCAHNFCSRCIRNYLKTSNKCPFCNAPASINDITPDVKMRQIIAKRHLSPKFCQDCKSHSEKLSICGHCNKDMCEICRDKHLNLLDIKIVFQNKSPEMKLKIKEFFERLSILEENTENATQLTVDSLVKYGNLFESKLDAMQNSGDAFVRKIDEQVSEAERLLTQIDRIINRSSGNNFSPSDIDKALADVKSFERIVSQFLQNINTPAKISLDDHTIQCLRELDLLELKPLK